MHELCKKKRSSFQLKTMEILWNISKMKDRVARISIFVECTGHCRMYIGFHAFVRWFNTGLLLMKKLWRERQCSRPTNTHIALFHLSVYSANTVGISASSPFFMSPEWFSPEKQSVLLEQSEPLSTQWQTRGWDIQVLPLNLVHPNISPVFILIPGTRSFLKGIRQPLNPNRPLKT